MNEYSKQEINKRLFNLDYQTVIFILKQVSIKPNETVPVELVKELTRLRKEINKLEHPIFTEDNLPVIEAYWKEFKYTGLNNVDYITSNFYKQGFGDNFTELTGHETTN